MANTENTLAIDYLCQPVLKFCFQIVKVYFHLFAQVKETGFLKSN